MASTEKVREEVRQYFEENINGRPEYLKSRYIADECENFSAKQIGLQLGLLAEGEWSIEQYTIEEWCGGSSSTTWKVSEVSEA